MTLKNKLIYVLTAAVIVLAVGIRLFAMKQAEALTIQPAAVEEDTVSGELTDVEQKYVDDFLEKANKEHELTPIEYTAERYKSGEVNVTITFEETSEVAVVRYDPYTDRWTGKLTLKGE